MSRRDCPQHPRESVGLPEHDLDLAVSCSEGGIEQTPASELARALPEGGWNGTSEALLA